MEWHVFRKHTQVVHKSHRGRAEYRNGHYFAILPEPGGTVTIYDDDKVKFNQPWKTSVNECYFAMARMMPGENTDNGRLSDACDAWDNDPTSNSRPHMPYFDKPDESLSSDDDDDGRRECM